MLFRSVSQSRYTRLDIGAMLYRNQDQAFEKQMKGKTAERRIGLDVLFKEVESGFSIRLTDEDGISADIQFNAEKKPALKPESVDSNIRQQLSKMGNSIYELRNIETEMTAPWFFPASQLSEWRRIAVELLDEVRTGAYVAASAFSCIVMISFGRFSRSVPSVYTTLFALMLVSPAPIVTGKQIGRAHV